MTAVLATNILSPLGYTTEQNYLALKAGRSALRSIPQYKGLPDTVTASVFDDAQTAELHVEGFTRFESLVIRSVKEALLHADVDVAGERTVFILSTTKANVEELSPEASADGAYLAPGETAAKIAACLGFVTKPIVVCNACISGVAAQMLAKNLLDAGIYDTAVVCGADCVTPFTIAGFMSFKALSPMECRPFDIERLGLNLGECAATMVMGRTDAANADCWCLQRGCLNNDAYHISAPSPGGEGVYRAMMNTIQGTDINDLALVCVHGTATMFNDQMESKAIEHAGLSKLPVSALKGYYGHTLGAAGVLETVITMRALDDGCILPCRGFAEIGVSGKVNISPDERSTDKRSFLKIISGFGGCNGAVLYSKTADDKAPEHATASYETLHSVRISQSSLQIDGQSVPVQASGKALLTEIYKTHIADSPKFYKMDMLGRLVFAASQLLIGRMQGADLSNTAVVLFNCNSSVLADRQHLATICRSDNFFPSPSVFVYTLPNIATGEVAIKNGCKAETSLYILDGRDEAAMKTVIDATVAATDADMMICGWADCSAEDCFEAQMEIITITR